MTRTGNNGRFKICRRLCNERRARSPGENPGAGPKKKERPQ